MIGSSPRLRGLLLDDVTLIIVRPVVPAPAGVAPLALRSSMSSNSRPRACGGCSATGMDRSTVRRSSPRLRGLLPHPGGLHLGRPVVPAPAGVAPQAARPPRRGHRRPRACGGYFEGKWVDITSVLSSPRLRGLLPGPGPHRDGTGVVPAPAGVAPAPWPPAGCCSRRPRACGGCSRCRPVVPTPAGVAPSCRPLRAGPPCVPGLRTAYPAQNDTRKKKEVDAHTGEGACKPSIQSLLRHGTQEQKDTFLSLIHKGELAFCLGYSESEAGSDLASLRTRAVRDGDHWVINGQKLWTTGGHESDWV